MSYLLKKDFENEFGVELLPHSFKELSVGQLVKWEGIFHKRIDFTYYTIADKLKISEKKVIEINKNLNNIKFQDANFPDMVIDRDFEKEGSFKIPGLDFSLSDKIDISNLISFSFKNIKTKVLTGKIRRELSKYLDELKEKDFSFYKDNIRNNYVIEALFYAEDVEINVKKDTNIDFDVEVDLKKIIKPKIENNLKNKTKNTYTIKGANCAFAAELVKGRNF